jgi:hypothetical protein
MITLAQELKYIGLIALDVEFIEHLRPHLTLTEYGTVSQCHVLYALLNHFSVALTLEYGTRDVVLREWMLILEHG